ncbi:EAL domain-containing protein [Actinotalea subterranea]|uniref:EAL domain-containing protein n=1 Tax=Actinotalea subterranea TaxID=2607497 RepID=UPI0011EEEE35|nr:EAL domain-containing protein [Actinotalea subterranea]
MAQPMTVLALVRSTGGFYHGALLDGLAREVAAADGRLVVLVTLDPGDRPDKAEHFPAIEVPVAWDHADGVVTVSLAAPAAYLERLRAEGKPVILSSIRVDGFEAPVALPNNHEGTFAAVEHLIAHGHRRIGFVGTLNQSDMQERYAAYLEALDVHGLESGPHLLFRAENSSEEGGASAAAELLSRKDRPTAVMVATDRNAFGLLDALHRAGLQVPEELAVVGFDNVEAGAFRTPSLSSVNQRFDEVGALAGRLVVASVRGEPVPAIPHSSPGIVVAARGSCGCTAGLFGSSDHRPVRGTDLSLDVVREELTDLLRSTLLVGHGPEADGPVLAAVAEVDRLLKPDVDPSADDVQGLITTLHRMAPRPEMLHRVASALHEYVQRCTVWGASVDGDASPGAARVAAALWQLQAGAYLRRSQSLDAKLEQQFGVDVALLDSRSGDPRSLHWLRSTDVRAATLALWDDEEHTRLRVVGSHGPAGLADPIGSVVPVRSFPTSQLIGAADARRREVCLVVPVRTSTRDWGMFAGVVEIDTTSARDTFRHWAALLCATFEGAELQATVRASEERYAAASRAANDGLWEWDLASDRVFLSDRCRDLLGLEASLVTDADVWSRVHPDDVGLVRDVMSQAMSVRDESIEAEFRVAVPDRAPRWLLLRGLGVGSGSGPVQRLVGSLSDIHPRKELEDQLRQGALYDTVTGLPNRRLFLERLGVAVRRPQRRRSAGFAVIFLDLDGFKLVNDSLGHLMGDELLKVVADRLRSDLRAVDTAARFGGDEFAVLLTDPAPDEVLAIAHRIQESITAPVLLGGDEVSVTASVGIATSGTPYTDPEDVLRDADIAMYHAKANERGSASVFDPEMHARATRRLRARGELRTALAEQQFVVHYQPIVDLDGAGLAHFEALVRWEHPERGLLPPAEFLPAMEDDASIVALGHWVLDEVCRQIAAWQAAHARPATVSVNVSHREFWASDLLSTVHTSLTRHGVHASSLVLEITESVMMSDPDAARAIMDSLHASGLRLHVDDFGTGQSSLHALRTFPVDALKIDGSFIRELGDVQQTTDLVRIILDMGRVLGMDVVAECVETPAQAERLHTMGCVNVQGWLYAKALPGADAGLLLGAPFARRPDPERVG